MLLVSELGDIDVGAAPVQIMYMEIPFERIKVSDALCGFLAQNILSSSNIGSGRSGWTGLRTSNTNPILPSWLIVRDCRELAHFQAPIRNLHNT